MFNMILRRLILFVPMWIAVSVLSFVIVHATPGDPAAGFVGQDTGAEGLAIARARLGLDRPYIEQLGVWVAGSITGDLGNSFFLGRSVADAIIERLPVTFSLGLLALLVAIVVGVPLGIIAALSPNSWKDASTIGLSLTFLSVPEFVVGMLLIYLLGVEWRLFPIGRYEPLSDGLLPWLHHLALPAVALGLSQSALLARMTRASLLQVLEADFIRTARAKGLPERIVVGKHAFRNAIITIITIIGLSMALLLSGAFITETLFQLPGIGSLGVQAVLRRDYPVIQGLLLVASSFVLIVNLLVDVVYRLLNPMVDND
ncbi:ABC transporter permease [Chelatococcus asaccharovorans]|uniref:ABC transporter permease n=1 Tax=Chelatococcus asaccharovorans TaxID=28210 RepID=UPI00224C6E7B|nr:ABC transporter permease [Chelatococcus asaccharovorans]CAH1673969.1 putative peptide transport system permease protein BAB2_1050 [Chelatococcus asaccharovorans]CAH1674654.1 putative peptide transport system permease protein BAB2_1050 [Chelatococcus asaccharovorans]